MNNKYIIGIFVILEIIFFYLYFYVEKINSILELQKLFLEVIFLIFGLLSGKLIYDYINYIKEKKLESLNSNINNILFIEIELK